MRRPWIWRGGCWRPSTPLLYARIDLARDHAGRWVLMEAELIEPDFYLDHDPAAGAGFARAVKARITKEPRA